MNPCDRFTPFRLNSEVCDSCGNLFGRHRQVETPYTPYREAVWKWLLGNGGVWNFYGAYSEAESNDTRAHLEQCGIDWKKTGEPRMESRREFNGTFAEEDAYVDAVIGELFCTCGQIRRQEWAERYKTLGQIIWQVVRAGEKT